MSNDPFKRFDITHLSPSALNCWRASPGVWALRYLQKIKDDGNAAMWRGTAVEAGWATLLRGRHLETAVNNAHASFDLNSQGDVTDELGDERDLIAPMLEQCLKWNPPSDLNATQIKVEHWFDSIPIPVVGYLDFAFEGFDVDLKTTKACPSTPRPDHVRQVSLYRAARNRQGGLLYVTAKRHQYFQIDDDMMARGLSDLESDARSLMHFLSRCHDKRDAVRSLPMDADHFMFPKLKVPLSEIMAAG